MNRLLCIFLVVSIFSACKENEEIVTVYEIEPDFEFLVDRFFEDAAARGIIIGKNNLIVKYGDPGEATLCGSCNSIDIHSGKQKIVIINERNICYDNSPDKEALIYHELGHCLLGRPHLDFKFPNGDPVSIMVSNSIHLYSPCSYAIGDVNECNQTHKRPYYINELFNPSTPAPDWSDN